jgi:hypothetical protein
MPAALGFNNQVNETLWITVKLKITAKATNFLTQILASIVYSGSSFVRTLNETHLHMQRIVGIKVEILASMDSFTFTFSLRLLCGLSMF